MKIGEIVSTARPRQLTQKWMERLRAGKPRTEPAPVAVLTNSPLFGTLLEQLGTVGRCRVLDLGPAVGGNVSFFGQLHCKLHIADCGDALVRLNDRSGQDDAPPLAQEFETLLPIESDEPFDAILGWDLFNYMDKPLYAALMEYLAPFVSGDTWLHAYIGSRREMAAMPNHYRLTLEGKIAVAASADGVRACPCYHQLDLRNLMPQFTVSRSTLLQNGMQEYLFKGQGRGHRGGASVVARGRSR